jgi:peptidoglycan/LPS O-acetylase OafA/YrhL
LPIPETRDRHAPEHGHVNQGPGWRLGRRPELDGLRGVAILLVLTCHVVVYETGARMPGLGSAGVQVFFALSGFLITALLIEERSGGQVRLTAFYERRARRLLPALALLLVVLVALRALMATNITPTIWPTVFYYANWSMVSGHDLGVLNPTWSLAVEEQFYLLWPVLLLLALRWRRGPVLLASIVIIGSGVLRFAIHDPIHVHAGLDTQVGPLVAGALLAILAERLPPLVLPRWVVAISVASLFAWAATPSDYIAFRWVPTVVPLLTVAVIWAACSRPGGFLAWPTLRYVGRRSYALYLWHTPMLWLVALAVGKGFPQASCAVVLSFAFAELSWRLVERPFQASTRRRAKGAPSIAPGMVSDAVPARD